MSSQLAGALVAAAAGLLAAPYLARLTLTVPDRDNRRWYRGAPASRTRVGVTASIAVVLGILGGLVTGLSTVLVPFVLLAVVCAPLIVIDCEHHRLPDRLVFVLALGAPLLALLPAAVEHRWPDYGRAAAAAGVVFAIFYAMNLVYSRGFGFGDVKLGGVMAAYLGWFGWYEVYYGILGGFVLGSVVAIALMIAGRAGRKTPLPFGPSLILGPLVVLAFDLVPRFG